MEALAKLRNLRISPRKVRLVADLIRGAGVTRGLAILKHAPNKCAVHLEKLLLSAITNWESKNRDGALETAALCVKAIWVDSAGMLKRIKPAPQGRAHRVRKRSSHITLVVGSTATKRTKSNMGPQKPIETEDKQRHHGDKQAPQPQQKAKAVVTEAKAVDTGNNSRSTAVASKATKGARGKSIDNKKDKNTDGAES